MLIPSPWSDSDGDENAREYASRYDRVKAGTPAPLGLENPPSHKSVSGSSNYEVTSEQRESATANACNQLQQQISAPISDVLMHKDIRTGPHRRHTMSEIETAL